MMGSLLDESKKLLVRRSLYRFYRALFQISIRGLGILNYEDSHLTGERHVLSNLRRYAPLDEDMVVFDVGANVGAYSNLVKHLYPRATLYAFEPHPITYETLRDHAQRNGYTAVNLGLDKTPGEMLLFDRGDGPGSAHASLYRQVVEQLHKEVAVSVQAQVTTLDQFAGEQGIARIGFLKIDTEGNEFNVLLGAQRLIQSGLVDLIQFEFNTMNVVSRVFMQDFIAYLSGYDLFRLLPDGLVSVSQMPLVEQELFGFQNILAIRNPNKSIDAGTGAR